ncbi:MAG: cupin domain-containing protein [Akkermansiaceae bacterium]|nr:cupin domain-containing protein [Akkermansiaceae bacterium]
MYSIREIAAIDKIVHPAVIHQTLIGPEQSKNVEVWYQTAKPGKPTPTHYHSGEEIIVVLQGSGWCKVGEEKIEFGPASVISVPGGTPHQLATTGDEDMIAVAILETPVEVFNREGKPIELPWPYGKSLTEASNSGE